MDETNKEYDEDNEIKCIKCKEISEKLINQRTFKPYTTCEKCRSMCGKRGDKVKTAKTNKNDEWKQIIFKDKDKETATAIYNIYENDIKTDDENSEATDETNNNDNIKGELTAGRVENVDNDNEKKNLTTLSLNEKVEYIIDLLETRNKAKLDNSKNDNNKNDDVIYEGFD